jgi:hypothetical protein
MTENTRIYRDDELGAALRALETPEHPPGFDADLRRRLAEEDARPAGLLRAFPRRARRRSVRRAVVAVTVAAVAALAIALPVADRLPGIGSADVASAAEVQARVRESIGSLESLSGVLVTDGVRWRFVLTSEGDVRLAGPSVNEIVTYDASEGIVRAVLWSRSTGVSYAERRRVAPGPPDVEGAPMWILPAEFGAFVRALLFAEDSRVQEVVYDGRDAWRLEVDAVPNAIAPEWTGDGFEITVDRETGIPVRVVELKAGAVLRELRIEQLAVDEDVRPSTFRLEFPADAEVFRFDEGFRRVSLDAARALAGYAPLVPAWVPEEFEPAEIAFARPGGPTGVEAGNPRGRNVVSLSYRRGFDHVVVTTRLAGRGRWSDPVATGEGYRDDPELITIGRGALQGAQAELLIVPRGTPHVWALHDGLVVTVAGALSRDELVRIAESLERR